MAAWDFVRKWFRGDDYIMASSGSSSELKFWCGKVEEKDLNKAIAKFIQDYPGATVQSHTITPIGRNVENTDDEYYITIFFK
jgi:hypothetical protein